MNNNPLNFNNCISFFDKSNYFEFFLKKSFDYNDLIEHISSSKNQFEKNFDIFSYNHSVSNFTCNDILSWQSKYRNFININKKFNTIDNYLASLLIANNNDFFIMPYFNIENKTFFEYINYGNPNFNVKYNSINSELKVIKKISKEPQQLDLNYLVNNFKTIRIKFEHDPSNPEKHIFLDLKYYGISTYDLCLSILSLPEFWRNFYFINQKKPPLNYESTINSLNQFLVETNNKNHIKILNDINNSHKFLINCSSIANQLIFVNPGMVLPLTKQEQTQLGILEPNVELTIKIAKENPLGHYIFLKSQEINVKSFLAEFAKKFEEREHSFTNYHGLSGYTGGQFIIHNNSEVFFHYEFNLLNLFSSLYKIQN